MKYTSDISLSAGDFRAHGLDVPVGVAEHYLFGLLPVRLEREQYLDLVPEVLEAFREIEYRPPEDHAIGVYGPPCLSTDRPSPVAYLK